MKVRYMPVLGVLRELYLQPRNMQRFRAYVQIMTGGGDDVVMPIGVANPMAKEQALAKIEELLAVGAEDAGASAARAASARLIRVVPRSGEDDLEIKASIVLADDVGGGWTNRYTTEAMVRFPSRGALKRPFATALAWMSESASVDQLRQEVLAAIYRVAYQQCFGLPASLAQRLDQEGLAAMFADLRPELGDDDLQTARSIVHCLGDDPPYPVVFAALYGDEAAQQLGYQPLGLPPRAGFAVAATDARDQGRDPIHALLRSPLE